MSVSSISFPKPLLKWVGGKTQIIEKLVAAFPTEIQDYHEIFLGGGSVLLAILALQKEGRILIRGKIHAYDINEPLIYTYKNIQTQHHLVYDAVQFLIDSFYECGNSDNINRNPVSIEQAKECKENYYYWIRSRYNGMADKKSIMGSAMFLFLNKTCFRGVFRVGPNGFNVPYGHYAHPEIVNRDHLEEIHRWIQGVVFECCDFSLSMAKPFGAADFIYLDPPYAPETATSFVGYTENGFPLEKHTALFRRLHECSGDGGRTHPKWLMSNADVDLVRQHFPKETYLVDSIVCKRAIHSKKPDTKAKEVLVKNF